jgi:hypothetical protein
MMQQAPPPPPGFYPISGGTPPPPPGFAPVAAAPGRPAPARPQAAGAPAPAGSVMPSRDELIAANLASGYDPAEAVRLADEDLARDDPGMNPAQPSQAEVQQQGAQDHALARQQNRAGGHLFKAVSDPWLLGEPTYLRRDVGGGDFGGDGADVAIGPPLLRTLQGGRTQVFDEASNAYYDVTPDQVRTIEARERQSQEERVARRERESNPDYQAEYAAAQEGSENVPKWLANLSHGNSLGGLTYAVGAANFLAPMTEGIDRNLASQAGRDAWRDRMDTLVADDPVGSVGMQMLGGLLTPGVKGSGDWIGSATGAARTGRAAVVGGAYGGGSGLLNAEGGLGDRLDDVALGVGVGAAGGGLLDMGARGAAARAAARAANPGPVRQLSRAGVDMMPGQLLSGVPVLGRIARGLEQGAASIPFVGAVPAAAERESVRSFDRAAINQVLDVIGERLPRGVSGRDAIRAGDDIISARYNADLTPVTINPDPQINARIQAAINPRNMSAATRNRLSDSAQDIVDRLQQPITGQEWKQIDSELSAAINSAARGGPDDRPLAQGLREVRAALGDALEQASPGTLARVRQTDDAFGNFQLIRKAASNPTTGRNDGLFTSSNLNSVLARSEGRAYGRGEARLQDITDAAEGAMAGTLPNSGSAERLATIGLASGTFGLGAAVNPSVAIPAVVGVSAVYSQPAQRLINAIYRATDPASASSALAELQRLAGRNPALQEYYANAARYLQGAFPDPSQGPAPEATGLLTPNGR